MIGKYFDKLLLKIRPYLVYPEKRYWCGSWLFYIKGEKLFFEACKRHDIQYEKWEWPRLKIDIIFLWLMMYATVSRYKNNIYNNTCIMCAANYVIIWIPIFIWDFIRWIFYFVVVLIIGWKFYKKWPLHFKWD